MIKCRRFSPEAAMSLYATASQHAGRNIFLDYGYTMEDVPRFVSFVRNTPYMRKANNTGAHGVPVSSTSFYFVTQRQLQELRATSEAEYAAAGEASYMFVDEAHTSLQDLLDNTRPAKTSSLPKLSKRRAGSIQYLRLGTSTVAASIGSLRPNSNAVFYSKACPKNKVVVRKGEHTTLADMCVQYEQQFGAPAAGWLSCVYKEGKSNERSVQFTFDSSVPVLRIC